MTNSSKIQQWLCGQGLYNCIIRVGDRHFKINATLGIQSASPEDVSLFPLKDAPKWLSEYVQTQGDRDD